MQIDGSRIVRPDYASAPYAALAAAAQEKWRHEEWGADGRYHESGLVLTADMGQQDYVVKSLDNVQTLQAAALEQGNPHSRPIEVLRSTDDIKDLLGTGGASGDLGYVNWGSGWADAEASIVYLYKKLEAQGRVEFMTDTVTRLRFSLEKDRVTGADMASGKHVLADLTIVAAGAWTPSLLDLRGIATATGQALAYTRLTLSERQKLADVPVVLNLSNGMFVIPPDNHGVLKFARHAYGYSNPTRIRNPEPHASSDRYITISIPPTTPPHTLPLEAQRALYQFQQKLFPHLAFRPFDHTRLCWYTDTPTGDWIIAYHPSYNKSLFVATGGSGHAFKFLPVIGEKIVQALLGTLKKEYSELWKWPEKRIEEAGWSGDGSRSGRRGMVLAEELKVREGSKL